jgi:hypothetical protein
MKNRTYTFIWILAGGLMLYFVFPVFKDIYLSLQNYNKRLARQSDYTKITTPLPRDVVDDICSKFEINLSDTRCMPDSVVYGPDFFGDIKTYFRGLPQKDATLQTVRNKLGSYLETCNNPDNEGNYRCWYDFRGDGIYSIIIYFTKENYIYRITDNVGDS